ncbi:hypothetical protein GGI19_004868 [Coemansia pectinata]|uniref:Glycoside hydrolase family 19 catalytic domain-containing protein n=1 Tax=Coemansia pectinata TaxID=1052879 RepID=A0A9W8GQU2_9FUNG|nr:hypothetical protein GGI19_004868 [Coemansia pectinata]
MVSLTSAATLLAIVLTAGCQVASASPQPQIQGTIVPRAAAAPELGDVCDINKDRIVCADEKSLLICDRNEWVQFSNCNLGTVCRNGNCVYPEASGSSPAASAPAASAPAASAPGASAPSASAPAGSAPAASVPGAASSSNAVAPSPSLAQSQPPSSTGSAAVSKPASSPGVAQPTSAATKSSAVQPSSAPSSSAGGGGGSESGGGGGDNFGITCDKFNKAVSAASSAISNSYPAPSSAQCNSFVKNMKSAGGIASSREAAMFLANILWESDGLRAKEEYDCQTLPDWCAQNYKTPEDVSGQTYWGRGYIQLTWHYNYLDASKGLYGDDRLAKDTAQVAKDEDIAWKVSFWFWKDRVRSDPGVQAGNFGASINKINGGLECRGSAQDKAKKRYAMYKAILPVFAPGETPKEAGCYN